MNRGKPVKLENPKAKVKDTATKRDHGNFRLQKGQEGQASYVEVCIRDAGGSYVWQRLVTNAYVWQGPVTQATLVEAPATSTEAPATLVETPTTPVEAPATPVETPATPTTT